MTHLLTLLLRRLPIGWLQLTHNRGRMAAALAGVAFANVLVLVQLGILGALNGTIAVAYAPFQGDIFISASDANTLTDGSPLARRVLYQALSDPQVAAAAPLYLGNVEWTRQDGSIAEMTVYGMPVEAQRFAGPLIRDALPTLSVPDTALIDRGTRGADAEALAQVSPDTPLQFEANGRTVTATGNFALGGSFNADGSLAVSDQTFLRLFPNRISGTPSHILVDVAPGADPAEVVARLTERLASEPVQVRSLAAAKADDLTYQTTQRPTGVIFGFSVAMAVVIGLVIVYQVLSTDVADHLAEYATFKAMGYPHRFFLSIVLEESFILGALGFLPGLLVALGLYQGVAALTGLPIAMTAARGIMVFIGTIIACAASGSLAARRLRTADPAELF
ncbi:putative ABC transport system permease protein [Rhodobacter sp. JA431]|uniref:ABC transporter permease DevC n=1 Tax=Rhodobacter sp. JA431 TaxID=570013 RepID=UPI000BDD034C|nr:ABC transporter permease DevC [Rhodobacter sp. JA431]SOC16238.1 putative ABC transport system permease protein [Rhodobacter sp. JA431]